MELLFALRIEIAWLESRQIEYGDIFAFEAKATCEVTMDVQQCNYPP